MSAGREKKEYVLIIRDDLSGLVWLWLTEDANAEAAADAFTMWLTSYGCIKWLMIDPGSHCKNNLIRLLTEELRIGHHFTTAYSAWENGSVERVCYNPCGVKACELGLACCTRMRSSVLNSAPIRRIGLRDAAVPGVYRTPLEVFTGYKPVGSLIRALPLEIYAHAKTDDEVRFLQLLGIDDVQEALVLMHREVNGVVSGSRKRSVAAHHRRTNVHIEEQGLIEMGTQVYLRWC